MVKLLKFSVVVNLLLACGAAWFAFKQFKEREIIKARMQRLETSSELIAKNLKIESDKAANLSNNIKDPSLMVPPLEDLEKHATARQQDLEVTKADLAQTKSELAATKDKLAATETELANTKQELEATKTDLASTKTQLEEARQKIDSLGVEIADLKTQINGLNETIAKKDDEIAKLDQDLALTKKELSKTKIELRIAKIRKVNGDTKDIDIGPMENQEAQVVLINKDWNFVIIDKGAANEFVNGPEGLLRRGDKLIGKVRVTRVEDTISAAEIIMDELEKGETPQIGDVVWFPPATL
jgi:chromosome segregation ATPase